MSGRQDRAALRICLCFVFSMMLFVACKGNPQSSPSDSISGVVLAEDGPIPGATVRVQATDNATLTDQTGQFTLTGLSSGESVFVTAWATGFYIVGVETLPGEDVEIHLVAHPESDNPDYAWLPSLSDHGQGEKQGCEECHSSSADDSSSAFPVDEWLQDAHSQSASNSRFLTMYTGQDTLGNQSPETRYAFNRDYGTLPLPPDTSRPYYGPGYKLDFPATDGNCATCHTPVTAVNDPYGVAPTIMTSVAQEGIPCDFCHKVWGVRLNSDTGLPYPNMPGVLSFEFRRPPDGHQFFAGPYDDVAPGEDTFSPLQNQSQFCAPCHFGVFWDTVVYNSYGEWLESPYSDPETGQTCQDCHMPTGLTDHFARLEAGGLIREPDSIFSHRMPGAADENLLQNAVTMSVEARAENGQVTLQIEIINDNTGHHVPTDSPLRHMILVVTAVDSQGSLLEQISGPVIPEWGGVGDLDQGYYAGLPGKIYAKVLEELWTEISPSGAYWNPTRIVSDNRIPAMGTDTTTFRFIAPSEPEVDLQIKLIFRRAFIGLMDVKKWDVPDILIDEQRIQLD